LRAPPKEENQCRCSEPNKMLLLKEYHPYYINMYTDMARRCEKHGFWEFVANETWHAAALGYDHAL